MGFSLYNIHRKDQRSCDGRGRGRGTKYDKYDKNRAALHFHGFFPKLEFPEGILYIILISPEGTLKLRWRGEGGGKMIVLGVAA